MSSTPPHDRRREDPTEPLLERPHDTSRTVDLGASHSVPNDALSKTAAKPDAANEEADQVDLSFLSPSKQPGSLGKLGDFEILGLVGRGGMGVVLRARDSQLERIVAVKVMAPELAASGPARQRFMREARTAAAVRHGNVVAIHSVEEINRVPFLVMQFVSGVSLQQRLQDDGPMELREIVRIGLGMAEGLAAAHKQGLIHRDIKPANILLEGSVGEVKITDFGLARAMDDASVTQSGVVTGTPLYMSPEQARGENVDHRSDLFSLGSVLYTMCVGHAPFRAANTMAVLRRVCEETPRSIREARPEIPLWLEKLIARLQAKDSAQRVQSAQQVADQLQRQFLALQKGADAADDPGATVGADEGQLSAYRPKARRSRTLAVGLMALLFLAGGVGAFLAELFPWQRNRDPIVEGPPPSRKPPDIEKPPTPPVKPEPGWITLFNGKDLTGWKTHEKQPGDWKVENGILIGRGPKRSHLFTERDDYEHFHFRCETRVNPHGDSGLYFRSAMEKLGPTNYPPGYEAQLIGNLQPTGIKTGSLCHVFNLNQQPEGMDGWINYEIIARANHLVTKLNGRTFVDYVDPQNLYQKGHLALQVFADNTTVEFRKIEIKRLPPSTVFPARTLADRQRDQIPEEELLEAGGGDPARAPADLVAVFNSSRLKHWDIIYSTLITPDGKLLLSAGHDGYVRVSRLSDGQTVRIMPGHEGTVLSLALSKNGVLASGGVDRTIRFWDIATGKQTKVHEQPFKISRISFSPDGKRLACGSFEKGGVRVIDTESGKPIWSIDDPPSSVSPRWSPDGKWIATMELKNYSEGEVRLRDAATGKVIRTLEVVGYPRWSEAFVFTPDGQRLAVLTPEDVTVFEVATGKPGVRIPLGKNEGVTIALNPDGTRLATSDTVNSIRVWDMATGNLHREMKGYTRSARALSFSPDGQYFIAGVDKGLFVWNADTGDVLKGPTNHYVWNGVVFSPDGNILAAGNAYGTRLWDTAYGQLKYHINQSHHTVIYSKDGNLLATCGSDKKIRISTPDVKEQKTLEGHTADIWPIAFSPDAKRLYSGSRDKTLRVWDVDAGKELQVAEQANEILCLALSPDGKFLVGKAGELTVWEAEGLKLVQKLPDHSKSHWVAFSPNGKVLASANSDGTITLFDPATWKVLRTLQGHTKGVTGVAFSPDSLTLASRSFDNRLLVWDVGSGTLLREWPLPGTGYRVTFSPDGNHIATGNNNGTGYVFRLPPNFRYAIQNVVASSRDLPVTATGAGFLTPDVGQLYCIARTNDGRHVVVGGSSGKVRVLTREGANWQADAPLTGHTRALYAAAFTPDGQILATGGDDQAIRLWLRKGTGWSRGAILTGHTLPVYGMAVMPDGKTLISIGGKWGADLQGEIKRWDLTTGRPILTNWPLHHTLAIRCLALSTDGKLLATSGADKSVVIRDTMTGEIKATLEGIEHIVHSLVFSPDGGSLLTGDLGGMVKQWKRNGERWELAWSVKARGYVIGVAVDPTGTLLATCGNQAQLWHLPTGDEIATLSGHLDRCDQVAFLPDGKTLLSLSGDGSVRRWEIGKGKAGTPVFAVLSREDRPERLSHTLAGAIGQARDGDTIEIRGNGPFEMTSLRIEGKDVTIRAGSGFRPVLVEREDSRGPLILSKGILTLEGLEIRKVGVAPHRQDSLVQAEGPELRLLNCRLTTQGPSHCFAMWKSGRAFVRNCELFTTQSSMAGINLLRKTDLTFENCAMTSSFFLNQAQNDLVLEDIRVRIQGCTIVGAGVLESRTQIVPKQERDGPITVNLRDNVIVIRNQIVNTNQVTALFTGPEYDQYTRKLFRWEEGKNVFDAPKMLWPCTMYREVPGATTLKTREDWDTFWKLPKGQAIHDKVRFVESFEPSKAASLPSSAFKLHPDSPGAKAGKDGRDLGIDVEMLGPSAYERFRKSPAYKDWQK